MIDALQDPPDLSPLPPNSAVLSVRAAPDRAHTLLRLTYDVTHLSDDRKKVLLFMLSQALTEIEYGLKKMDGIAVAAKLAKLERIAPR